MAKTATKARTRQAGPSLDEPITHPLARIDPRKNPDPTPTGVLALAMAEGADLDRLERLLKLKREWEADEARKAFVADMALFKKEQLVIDKDKHVTYPVRDGDPVDYWHATLGNVCETIESKLGEYGFSHHWDFDDSTEKIAVTCIITHRLGHERRTTLRGKADASGKKNDLQKNQSTVTYLERYTLLGAVGKATRDQDDDGGDPRTEGLLNEAQVKDIYARIKDAKVEIEPFLRHLSQVCKLTLTKVEDIPAVSYRFACQALDERKKRGAV